MTAQRGEAAEPRPSFADFSARWMARAYPREWRQGQALFNLLHDVRPELARELSGSLIDPFYNDNRIVAAMSWIAEHWGDPR